MINIAVLGYGTVGSGVVEVIETNKAMINHKAGEEIEIKYILDIREFPGDPYEDKVIHDVNQILEDESVNILCETMGGIGKAYEFTKQALERGKSVCTSNKELVAKYGPKLLAIAKAHRCNYLFEASVGGGIPIIRPLNYSLTAERIEAICGILNGTTNYILTKMENEGADYDLVLKRAQEIGYAERNPAADVEGHDACRKIAILSSLMMSKTVDYEKIHTEGITKITQEDIHFAKSINHRIKLLAMSRQTSNGLSVMVAPFMIPLTHPLTMVNDVFNAVFVTGNMLGDSMYYGRGAGKLPTASAVVSDVIDCARHIGKSIMCFWDEEEVMLCNFEEQEHAFFLRIAPCDLERIKAAFPGGNVLTLTKGDDDQVDQSVGYQTLVMKEKEFAAKRESLGDSIISSIRFLSIE
jgi:homoserine dehydrogenase